MSTRKSTRRKIVAQAPSKTERRGIAEYKTLPSIQHQTATTTLPSIPSELLDEIISLMSGTRRIAPVSKAFRNMVAAHPPCQRFVTDAGDWMGRWQISPERRYDEREDILLDCCHKAMHRMARDILSIESTPVEAMLLLVSPGADDEDKDGEGAQESLERKQKELILE